MAPGSPENALPRWNLASIYPSLDSREFRSGKKLLKLEIRGIGKLLDGSAKKKKAEIWIADYVERYNRTADLFETLFSYAYMIYSTDTRNALASREISALENLGVPLKTAEVNFRNRLADLAPGPNHPIWKSRALAPYRYFLKEQLKLQKRQMRPELEELAADLSRSGGDAWERLHQSLSSTLVVPWEGAGRKTVVELRALPFDPDREIRRKANEAELAACKSDEVQMALAINGVKGFSASLNDRRGFRSTLERSILQARITPKTLEALVAEMTAALPLFRRYLRAKAKALGVRNLAFFDLFAPVGKASKRWSFDEAADFIVDKFTRFSPELGTFARKAFDDGWIDAEPREGKVGGAYCIALPLLGESRVFSNFEGSIGSVTTLAHELGHAYHHEVLKAAPSIHRSYPMPLAETASLFSETVVFAGALENAGRDEKLTLVENFLQDATQVIVDILSRFRFEQRLMTRREEGELAPDELSALMIEAQKETYGDALDPEFLHPYMWAVKGHYYRQDLAFYNFPYAFGQLFGLALFSRYRREGPAFTEAYRKILGTTGRGSANEVTRKAGFDIESREFWRSGIADIERYVKEFEEML